MTWFLAWIYELITGERSRPGKEIVEELVSAQARVYFDELAARLQNPPLADESESELRLLEALTREPEERSTVIAIWR